MHRAFCKIRPVNSRGPEPARETEGQAMAARKPIKLFKIGEVMEYAGLSRQTIHNYTMLGLIKPARRTKAGHRLYGEEVFEILERVKELKRDHTLTAISAGQAPILRDDHIGGVGLYGNVTILGR